MKIDSSIKVLADYNDVFADIMNVILFDGEQVIDVKGLENAKDRSQYKADGDLHEQERDVSKFYNGELMREAFLGIEHENRDEPFMPFRIISYDGAVYRSQLLEKGKTKPFPVITLVLYFGMKHWPHGKSLHEVMEIPEKLKPFVSDYRINVVEVAYLKPEQIEKFQSDFRYIAEFFVQKRTTGDYKPPNFSPQHTDAFFKLLSRMVGDKRYYEIIQEMSPNQEKEGEIEMCEVYDKIENRGIEKGIALGKEIGKEEGKEIGIEEGKLLIIVKLINDKTYTVESAAETFGISEDAIRKELDKQAG